MGIKEEVQNITPGECQNYLLQACINGNYATYREIIEQHAEHISLNDKKPYRMPDAKIAESYPIICAATGGSIEIVKDLLDRDVGLNVRDDHKATPLFYAALEGHLDIVRELLVRDAIVDAKANNGATPLIVAAQGGHSEIVQDLLNRGAKIDGKTDDDTSSLHISSANGHLEVVKELLARGARVDEKDSSGLTPLISASDLGRLEIVRELLTGGAIVDEKTPEQGIFSLYISSVKGHAGVVKELLIGGANVDEKFNGATPLSFAAQLGHLEVVKELLIGGANIDEKNKLRATPSYIAKQEYRISKQERHSLTHEYLEDVISLRKRIVKCKGEAGANSILDEAEGKGILKQVLFSRYGNKTLMEELIHTQNIETAKAVTLKIADLGVDADPVSRGGASAPGPSSAEVAEGGAYAHSFDPDGLDGGAAPAPGPSYVEAARRGGYGSVPTGEPTPSPRKGLSVRGVARWAVQSLKPSKETNTEEEESLLGGGR